MVTLTVSFQSMMGRERVRLARWALHLLYQTTKPQVTKLGVNAPCFEHYNPHGVRQRTHTTEMGEKTDLELREIAA